MTEIVFAQVLNMPSVNLLLLRRALVEYTIEHSIPMSHCVTDRGFTVCIDDDRHATQWLLQWNYPLQEFYIRREKIDKKIL